jgi:CHAT domain-containing protein/Tfp pilus assembly protein PilF
MSAANQDPDDLFAQAVDHYQQGDYQAAVYDFRQIEAAARAQGNHKLIGTALINLGAAYAEMGDFQAAQQKLLDAREVSRANGDLVGECQSNLSLATVYQRMEDWETAHQTWQAALELARRMFNAEMAETATNGIADTLIKMGRPEEGLTRYQKLLNFHEKAGDKKKIIDTLINMIRVELDRGDTSLAEMHGQKALFLSRQIEDKTYEAYCQYKLGSVYHYTGFNTEARSLLTRSVEAYRQLKMPEELGLALNSLGMVYDGMGLYQDALAVHQETLQLAEAAGDKSEQGSALHGIGSVYHKIGRFPEAETYYRRALTLTEEAGDIKLAALTLTNLGVIAADMGRDDEALPILKQAAFYQQQFGDLLSQGQTLISISALYQRNGDLAQAQQILQDALAIQKQTGARNSQAVTLNALGEIQLAQGRFEEALIFKNQSLTLFRKIANPVGEIEALYAIARLHARAGTLDQAVEVLDEAIQAIEGMRLNLVSEDLRTAYFSHMQNVFAFYVEVLLALDRYEDAFRMVERSKARAFLDLLSEAQSALLETLDPALAAEDQRLLSEMDAVQRQIKALTEGQADRLLALQDQMQALERSYQINQAAIRKGNPRYSALTQPNIWGIHQVQHELLDEHTALLEYILGEKVSTLFVVLKNGYQVFRLPPRAEIEGLVKELRASLTLHRYLNGDTLYRALIKPAEAMIQGKDLLIVADGVLHYLPFSLLLTRPPTEGRGSSVGLEGAMRSVRGLSENDRMTERIEAQIEADPPFDFPNLPYLIWEHAIRYISSASVAGMVRKEGRSDGQHRSQGLQIAALADPVIHNVGPVQGGALRAFQEGLTPLPHTTEEAWALAGLFERVQPQAGLDAYQSGRVQLFTGERATKAQALALTDGSQDYRFLHIATHGLLDIEHPQFSGLLFSSQNADPYWQTFEIFKARIPAETVVLSACETGLGKVIRGEGLVGLSRAFLYAGASRVCVSLWKVADISTPELMKAFYQAMLVGKPAAGALRQAQLELISEGTYSHPFFWAAFIIVGKA